MAKSKSHNYKNKGKRPQTKPQKAQSAKQQDDDLLPVSGNRQARRAQEQNPHRSTGKPRFLRILIVVMLIVMLLGFFIAPLLSTH